MNMYEMLTPELIIKTVEKFLGIFLDGTIIHYNSYINRVYGLTDEDNNQYVVKFYRPNRWSIDTINDEHEFLIECSEQEIPVIAPIRGATGETVGRLCVNESLLNENYYENIEIANSTKKIERVAVKENSCCCEDSLNYTKKAELYFAVFPRIRARTFDIYSEDDWIRTGRVIGRLHMISKKKKASYRLFCTPETTTEPYIRLLLGINDKGQHIDNDSRLVTEELRNSFMNVCDNALDIIEIAFSENLTEGDFIRIHGDLHRGNILEIPVSGKDEGIINLIDFDDMMMGAAIQDLWLLLPDYYENSKKEMNLLLEGYEEFSNFNRNQLKLIEPLRFMRHIYFLAWQATQKDDVGFEERNISWGTKTFWEKEIIDLQTQLEVLKKDCPL